MSDIADKIYAATGLTLGAEAAAAIERLIQAENEKLRAENEHLATSNHAYLSGYQEAIAEIEKLRAALRGVLTYYNAPTPAEAKLKKAVLATPIEQARAALGEKE